MSLLAALPAPARQQAVPAAKAPVSTALISNTKEIPPYLRRKNFIPRKLDDFGDGGAFPEIHVAQYPHDMGKEASRGGKTLAVTVDSDGHLQYDAIVKQGANKGKVVHSGHQALVPKVDRLSAEANVRPSEDEVKETARATLATLEKVVSGKLASVNPGTVPKQPQSATLIKYTPTQQGAQFASGAGQRVIKMQDMPVDPLEPPKFRHVKVPRGTGSPPVPVLHSPPRPMTVKDRQDWKIPPCISNWKNPKGYTIPLDKRLAADGRSLTQLTISNKAAKLSEALYNAEKAAREETTLRGAIQKELQQKERERREKEQRAAAMQARLERGGAVAAAAVAAGFGGAAAPGGLSSRLDAGEL